MRIYIAGNPENHHSFLKTINKCDFNEVSLLHIDNHRDDMENGTACARYMCDVKKRFPKVNALFINKVENSKKWELAKDVEGNEGKFLIMKYGFFEEKDRFIRTSLSGIPSYLEKMLGQNVVVDIDPDVVGDYGCEFKDTGCMSEEELRKIVEWVAKNKKIEYYFFASTLGFASRITDNLHDDVRLSLFI